MIRKIRLAVAVVAAALSLSAASFAGVTIAELNAVQPIIQLDDNGQYEQAWQALKPLVKANNGRAMYFAAFMFSQGHGIPAPDGELALRYYKLSDENGFYVAAEMLGEIYRDGRGVPKDSAKALELFRRSAICGYESAIVNFGAMNGRGDGVPKNLVEAYAWYINAPKSEVARGNIHDLDKLLSPDQIAQANRRAEEIRSEIAQGRRAWYAKWGDGPAITSAVDANGGLPITFDRDASGRFAVKTFGGKIAEMEMVEAGDTLVDIDGTPVTGLTMAEVERLLAGPVDSNIQLRLDHKGTNTQLAMPREKIDRAPATKPVNSAASNR